jgi:hypothetical protein
VRGICGPEAQRPFAGVGSQPLRSAPGQANGNGPEPALFSGGGLAHRLSSNRRAEGHRSFHYPAPELGFTEYRRKAPGFSHGEVPL